jgi:hypothetical protein
VAFVIQAGTHGPRGRRVADQMLPRALRSELLFQVLNVGCGVDAMKLYDERGRHNARSFWSRAGRLRYRKSCEQKNEGEVDDQTHLPVAKQTRCSKIRDMLQLERRGVAQE